MNKLNVSMPHVDKKVDVLVAIRERFTDAGFARECLAREQIVLPTRS